MEFTHIKATNFQSFKELYYEFNNGVPTLIVGENQTDDDQESNGSGKSVLMTGPEYCILHTTSKKVNDKDLIYWHDGAELAEIELGIFCPLRRQVLVIQRRIHVKQGGSAQLTLNGVIKWAFTDKMVDEIDRYIIDWIGISKSDLQNYFILSKFKYTSFFAASNTNLIQLIGRFSNSSIIAGIDKDIESTITPLEAQRTTLFDRKNRLLGMIDAHNINIETSKTADKEALLQAKLDEIDDKIIEEGDKLIHYQTQIGIENDQINSYNADLDAIYANMTVAKEQLRKVEADMKPFEAQYQAIDTQLQEVSAEKEHHAGSLAQLTSNFNEVWLTTQEIERNIKGSVKCPNCNFQFLVGREDVSIEQETIALAEAVRLSALLTESIEDVKAKLAAFDPKLRDLRLDRIAIESRENELRTMKGKILNNIQGIERNQNNINISIQACANRIATWRESIRASVKKSEELTKSKGELSLDSFDNTEWIAAAGEEITKCESEIQEIDHEYAELGDKIFSIRHWAFVFKEFHQWLSVKTLKILQGYANKFLEDIGSDLRIMLEGFKIKSDGTLSDKITAYIIRDGAQKEFGNFSGGERARLEAAMILAVQTAINSTNKFGGLDYLSIDEIFESVDGKGISTLTNSFMGLNKTILLTTHIPGNSYECTVLKVVKSNKTSTIQIKEV